MENNDLINERVHAYYWIDDINCAKTTLKTLAEIFEINLSSQVVESATGLPDKGIFGLPCGLVQGSLMFIGILGQERGLDNKNIVELCNDFANRFQNEFGCLTCKGLRPQGFKPENPPHLCEEITKKAIRFGANYINALIQMKV